MSISRTACLWWMWRMPRLPARRSARVSQRLGIPNFSQAGRVLRLQLDRAIRGNTYVEFETGVRGVGLKPGDLITITYLKEGLDRQLFRIDSDGSRSELPFYPANGSTP